MSRIGIVALFCLCLAGCAGYRGGWESRAYIGDVPPPHSDEASTLEETRSRATLVFPGLQMQVGINNQLRTYDTQVYLYALPLSIDPRHVYPKTQEPGKTRVYFNVTPAEAGFVFHPAGAVLRVEGKEFAGIAGFDFDMWDEQGNRVKEGGNWDHRPVGTEFVLTEPGRRYYLSVDFVTPLPSPESHDIALDLSRALRSQQYPALPLIRFTPIRWKEGYT